MKKIKLKTQSCYIESEESKGINLWKIYLRRNRTYIGNIALNVNVENNAIEPIYKLYDRYKTFEYIEQITDAITNWAYTQKDTYYVDIKVNKEELIIQRVLDKLEFEKVHEDETLVYYEKEAPKTNWMSLYMCIGMSMGVAFGSSGNNLATGMCIGICIGLGIGSSLDASDKKKREEIRAKRKELKKF